MAISRRKAIFGTIGAAGALVVGYALWPYPQKERQRALLGHGKDAAVMHTWIKVGRDNRILILSPHQDFGQGSSSVLAQMAADEMDADWSLVTMQEAPAHEAFANADIITGMAADFVPPAVVSALGLVAPKLARAMGIMMTGGSSAIRATGQHGMRPAGAAVRAMFVAAAAKTWNVPAAELTTANSTVKHAKSGKTATYGELIDVAAEMSPGEVRLKTPDRYTLMGKPLPRLDVPEKVNGTAPYAIDTRVEGMKYAAIRHSPVFGGAIESVDDAAVLKRPGVTKVIRLDPVPASGLMASGNSEAAVVVIADNTWRAESAVRALAVKFTTGANANVSTAGMFADFERAVGGAPKSDLKKEGDVEAAFPGAAKIVEATYRAPFLDHAPMEPHSSTVVVRDNGTAEVWVGSQMPLMVRSAVAGTLGLKAENVVVHNLRMGGGFGRRSHTDGVVEAARIAREMPNTPVKLTWSREEDIQHGKYRPASVSRFKAALDANGKPVAWLNVYNWHDDSAALIPYAIANQHIGHVDATAPIPTGPWRSVGHSRHAFYTESFTDELAHAAGKDPYLFRQELVAHAPRFKAVLDLAAEKGNWGAAMPKGAGRGIALHEAFGSITAQVAEVSPGRDGVLKVDKMTCVIDCGTAMNPQAVEAQVQGGVLYGLSAALYGEITIKDGRVEQSNFNDYRSLTLADAPPVTVHIVNSGAPMGGVGEPGTPGAAPAVANAVFAATGTRLRAAPFKLHELGKSGDQG